VECLSVERGRRLFAHPCALCTVSAHARRSGIWMRAQRPWPGVTELKMWGPSTSVRPDSVGRSERGVFVSWAGNFVSVESGASAVLTVHESHRRERATVPPHPRRATTALPRLPPSVLLLHLAVAAAAAARQALVRARLSQQRAPDLLASLSPSPAYPAGMLPSCFRDETWGESSRKWQHQPRIQKGTLAHR
jgi:hypothetical protein